jgi:hypothetical protein
MSGNKFSWLPIWILYSLVVGGGGVFSLTLSDKEPPRMEVLHTILRSSVASKFWKVVLNLRFSSKDFLSEQILLVEEQNHRDGTQPSSKEGEASFTHVFCKELNACSKTGSGFWGHLGGQSCHTPVVPDALEEVQSLLQAVGLVVLPNDHVVAAAGHHEDDGSHICITETVRIRRRTWSLMTTKAHAFQRAAEPTESLPLKHWIHLRRSSRWPPTSNMLVEKEDTGYSEGSTALTAREQFKRKGTIHLLEVDFVHLELGLKDSRGQDTASKQVLKQGGGQ